MNKEEQLWDKFKTKPASSIAPVKSEMRVSNMDDIIDLQIELYKHYNINDYHQYKKGACHQVVDNDDYTQFLAKTIKITVQCVRDSIDKNIEKIEDQQHARIRISRFEAVMLDLIDLLKTFNFSIDINSVTAIMHGYINESVRPLFNDYETRRSTKHQHLRETDNQS